MKCDELESFIVRYNGKFIRAYEESEVDSAIDELKREHHRERDEYIDWVNRLQKEYAELKEVYKDSVDVKVKIWERCKKEEDELRHHKYKRCLAMAEVCMHKRWRTDEGFDYARSTRHMNKWLELAEKFKTSSTAQ